MNCWLEDRKKRFENLFTKEELVNPHIAVIKPNEIDLRWLKKAQLKSQKHTNQKKLKNICVKNIKYFLE